MRVLTPVTVFEIIFLLDTIVSLDSEFTVLWISASHQDEQKSVVNSFFCNFVILYVRVLILTPPPTTTPTHPICHNNHNFIRKTALMGIKIQNGGSSYHCLSLSSRIIKAIL